MVYSRSAGYAIRALIYLARNPEAPYTMARTIAGKEGIPAHFLAKILQDLTRQGLLRSNKGPSGGFALRVPAAQIKVLDIVKAVDGNAFEDAATEIPWPLEPWQALHSRIMEFLGKNTVAQLARGVTAIESRKPSRKPAGRRP